MLDGEPGHRTLWRELQFRSLRSSPVAREIVGLRCDSRFLAWVVVADPVLSEQ